MLILLGSVLLFVVAFALTITLGMFWIIAVAGVVWILSMTAVMYLLNAAGQVYTAALYLYAAEGAGRAVQLGPDEHGVEA